VTFWEGFTICVAAWLLLMTIGHFWLRWKERKIWRQKVERRFREHIQARYGEPSSRKCSGSRDPAATPAG
jgi:hypothetical protein